MKVILTSCHFHFRAHILLPNMSALLRIIKRNASKLAKAKIAASELESLREFGVYYKRKFKRDYPDIYDESWDRSHRRRLTETPRKRPSPNIVTPSPARVKRLRFDPVTYTPTTTSVPVRSRHIPAMVRRARSRRPMRRMRRVRRRVSRKRTFKRKQLARAAEPRKRGVAPAKREAVHALKTLSNFNGNELYTHNLTLVAQGDAINQRERQSIDVSGFRIRYYIKNTANTANEPGQPPNKPLLCNMAIVWQDGKSQFYDGRTHFFHHAGVNRYTAFGGTGDSLTGWDKYTLPMNIEQGAVLWHTRFKLGNAQTSGNFGAGSQNTWRTISRYIKIKRRVMFHGPAVTDFEGSFWLLVWCNHIDQTPIDGTNANTFQLLGETQLYFRDPGV